MMDRETDSSTENKRIKHSQAQLLGECECIQAGTTWYGRK